MAIYGIDRGFGQRATRIGEPRYWACWYISHRWEGAAGVEPDGYLPLDFWVLEIALVVRSWGVYRKIWEGIMLEITGT